MNRKAYQKAYKQAYRADNRSVTLTVSKADYARLQKAAKAEGKKPTTLLHELAFAGFYQALYVPAELKAQLSELNFLVLNIANNVNQIAHWSNTVAQAPDYRLVLSHIERLHNAVQDYTHGRLGTRSPVSTAARTSPLPAATP